MKIITMNWLNTFRFKDHRIQFWHLPDFYNAKYTRTNIMSHHITFKIKEKRNTKTALIQAWNMFVKCEKAPHPWCRNSSLMCVFFSLGYHGAHSSKPYYVLVFGSSWKKTTSWFYLSNSVKMLYQNDLLYIYKKVRSFCFRVSGAFWH